LTHTCHTMGCTEIVPPKMLMCRNHWFELPKSDRDLVWQLYSPGQEITKTPSVAYVQAVNRIILEQAQRLGLIQDLREICRGCMETMPIKREIGGHSYCEKCVEKIDAENN
jgi:hypothetical protein